VAEQVEGIRKTSLEARAMLAADIAQVKVDLNDAIHELKALGRILNTLVETSQRPLRIADRVVPSVPDQKPDGNADVVCSEILPKGQHPDVPGQLPLGDLD
jgi:hypothetical protein